MVPPCAENALEVGFVCNCNCLFTDLVCNILVCYQVLLGACAAASGILRMAARFSGMVDCMSRSAVTQASGCMATAPAAVCPASGLDIHHCVSVSHLHPATGLLQTGLFMQTIF